LAAAVRSANSAIIDARGALAEINVVAEFTARTTNSVTSEAVSDIAKSALVIDEESAEGTVAGLTDGIVHLGVQTNNQRTSETIC
jgi:hypothetical protein